MLALGTQIAHCLAHADGAVRRLDGRHHCFADRLYDGALSETVRSKATALVDSEGVGPMGTAEGLIGEEPLRCENGLAPPESVQCLVRHPDGRHHAAFGAISQSQVKRPGRQF